MTDRLHITDDARAQLLSELAIFRGRRPVVFVSWQPASAELTRTESGGSRLTRWPAEGYVVVGIAPRNLDPSLVIDVKGIPVFLGVALPEENPPSLLLELEEGSVVVRLRT